MTSTSGVLRALAPRQPVALTLILLAAVLLTAAQALAHNVTAGDAGYIQEIWGGADHPLHLPRRQAHGDRL